jgi:hypothetical protein
MSRERGTLEEKASRCERLENGSAMRRGVAGREQCDYALILAGRRYGS